MSYIRGTLYPIQPNAIAQHVGPCLAVRYSRILYDKSTVVYKFLVYKFSCIIRSKIENLTFCILANTGNVFQKMQVVITSNWCTLDSPYAKWQFIQLSTLLTITGKSVHITDKLLKTHINSTSQLKEVLSLDHNITISTCLQKKCSCSNIKHTAMWACKDN